MSGCKDIEDTIDTFQSEGLKKIVREMLRLTGDKLEWFPAAQRLHHAERSGLLHHTTSMLNLARHVVAAYPFLNAELLYAGVILHDLCKTTEMISDETGSVSDYSADGLLIGHLVRGVARIEEAAKNVGVSGEIVLLLEHMVLSHHSIPEYGSPKAPMFPEAEVLARIRELLRPEGMFLSATDCLGERLTREGVRKWWRSHTGKMPYVSFDRMHTLEASIAAAGFEVLETENLFPAPPNLFVAARKK